MILVDSSVCINDFRSADTPQVAMLDSCLRRLAHLRIDAWLGRGRVPQSSYPIRSEPALGGVGVEARFV